MAGITSDPFDASTLGASLDGEPPALVATVRFVFRAERSIVDEPARVLRTGVNVVGRARDADVLSLPDDPRASRHHAELLWQPLSQQLSVRDCGSRNGIAVNGSSVEQAPLDDGDVVRFGNSFCVVRLQSATLLDVPNETLLGASPAMQTVRVAIRRYARDAATVLVCGETGVGKELIARALHEDSGRAGPFVAVNCTGLTDALADSQLFGHVEGAFTGAQRSSPGFFRAAGAGTLLLDEVGDMSVVVQPKLLRALETRTVVPVGATSPVPFKARVIAATNVALPAAVNSQHFRADLLARLAQLVIEVPPLRERREDILALLARNMPAGVRLPAEFADVLLTAAWPRNARQVIALASEIRILVDSGLAVPLNWKPLAARLRATDRSEHVAAIQEHGAAPETANGGEPTAGRDGSLKKTVPSRDQLDALMQLHRGNVAAIAKQVGRSRAQVYRWMRKHQLDLDAYR